MEERLLEREQRQTFINRYPRAFTLVIVKTNLPGPDKLLFVSFLLNHLFSEEIKKHFFVFEHLKFAGVDGAWQLLALKKPAKAVKWQMVKLENAHPLGKFIDIDVYDSKRRLLSRRDLGIPERLCWLCSQSAIFCTRNRTHETSSLLTFLFSSVQGYLADHIRLLVEQAGMDELNIPDKFGLVTPFDNGSHPDMNYELMKTSLLAIIPLLLDIFKLGYLESNEELAINEAIRLGQEAEQTMLDLTKGINTYKGLIYALGMVLLALGRMLRLGLNNLFLEIGRMGRIIEKKQQETGLPNTFGSRVYQNSHIKGIRGEVSRGLPSVLAVFDQFNDFSNSTLRKILIKLIVLCEDTVLLKRAGNLKRYQAIKEHFANLDLEHFDAKQLTEKCLKEHLSFGGAADLLVIAIFLKRFSQTFHLSLTNLDLK